MLSLITDRTDADVAYVKSLAALGWSGMTTGQQTAWVAGLKGSYNYVDYNRVGNAIQTLTTTLNANGFAIITNPKTNWTINDTPTPAQLVTYLADLNTLKNNFYSTTPLPTQIPHMSITDSNNIEIMLTTLDNLLAGMIATYMFAGTFESGEVQQ